MLFLSTVFLLIIKVLVGRFSFVFYESYDSDNDRNQPEQLRSGAVIVSAEDEHECPE